MRPFTHKIGAVLLAQLLLFSTLSFTMDMHFCGKTLVDFSLFHEAEDCGMSAAADLMADWGCCSDVEVVVQGQDEVEQAASLPDLPILVATYFQVVYIYTLSAKELREYPVPFQAHAPPNTAPDVTIRYQRFLI